MEIKLNARYLKHTPDKIRLIIKPYVGMKLKKAITETRYISKSAALDVYKLIKSAESACKEKEMDIEKVFIKYFFCNEGPKLKRRIPRSKGRVSPFVKRLSHLSLIVSEDIKIDNNTKKGKSWDKKLTQ